MNCDPNSLALAAKCFQCLSESELMDIYSYLLCAWTDAVGPPPPGDSLLITDDGDFITAIAGDFILIHS